MQVDWLTVVAQIVNFLILVYLLRRFLYAPVMAAMDEREARIAGRLRAAAEQAEAAENEAQQYEHKRVELERDRHRLLAEAHEESAQLQRSLEQAARQEVEDTRRKWLDELERERETWRQDVRREVAQRVIALARHALGDLASSELERQIVATFAARLRALPEERRRRLQEASRSGGHHVSVCTAFDLAEVDRDELSRVLREAVADEVRVGYVHADDLACGIELRAGGETLRWSLDGYLDAFHAEVDDALAALSPHGEDDRGC